jgi:hypothetical protein
VQGIDFSSGGDCSVLSQMKVKEEDGKYLFEMVCYERIGRQRINHDAIRNLAFNPWPDWCIAIEDEYDGPKDSSA